MQDTTDLKSDILNEIKYNKSVLSEKDVAILNKSNEANYEKEWCNVDYEFIEC